jgi:uncharacterized membrane protein YcjF (UPF0283 family)
VHEVWTTEIKETGVSAIFRVATAVTLVVFALSFGWWAVDYTFAHYKPSDTWWHYYAALLIAGAVGGVAAYLVIDN